MGDIVNLNQGDRVPADCIVLDEMKLKVDESMYFPDHTEVEKEESRTYEIALECGAVEIEDNHKDHPDPFLFTDSKIIEGQGRALVCCVG